MKTIIIYDSKNGTTKQFCQWVKEGFSTAADIVNVNDVVTMDYDLIVIGTPVYFGAPLKSIITFIRNRQDELLNKKIALFIVYLIKEKIQVGKTEFNGSETVLNKLIESFPVKPAATAILMGKLEVEKLDKQSQMVIGRILQLTNLSLEDAKTATKEDCIQLGRRFEKTIALSSGDNYNNSIY